MNKIFEGKKQELFGGVYDRCMLVADRRFWGGKVHGVYAIQAYHGALLDDMREGDLRSDLGMKRQ